MDIKGDLAQILSGMDIIVPQCNIAIHQPDIRSICAYGEDNFLFAVQMFVYAEKTVKPIREGNSQLARLSDFQLLMVIIDEDGQVKKNISKFFELVFPQYDYNFAAGSIEFLDKEGEDKKIVGMINPMNFQFFSNALKILFLPSTVKEQEEGDYRPANDQAAKIAAKLREGREIREKLKSKDQGQNSSLFSSYISILSVGLSMDINIFYGYTPFQLYDVFLRYNKKLSYDLYQKIATTPLMSVEKMEEPDNWLDDLYK